jgi:hypothetical protein
VRPEIAGRWENVRIVDVRMHKGHRWRKERIFGAGAANRDSLLRRQLLSSSQIVRHLLQFASERWVLHRRKLPTLYILVYTQLNEYSEQNLGGHLKTGQSGSPQNRPVERV